MEGSSMFPICFRILDVCRELVGLTKSFLININDPDAMRVKRFLIVRMSADLEAVESGRAI